MSSSPLATRTFFGAISSGGRISSWKNIRSSVITPSRTRRHPTCWRSRITNFPIAASPVVSMASSAARRPSRPRPAARGNNRSSRSRSGRSPRTGRSPRSRSPSRLRLRCSKSSSSRTTNSSFLNSNAFTISPSGTGFSSVLQNLIADALSSGSWMRLKCRPPIAPYMRTGTCTRPNEIEPVHSERGTHV